jgi:hypothetical protein
MLDAAAYRVKASRDAGASRIDPRPGRVSRAYELGRAIRGTCPPDRTFLGKEQTRKPFRAF